MGKYVEDDKFKNTFIGMMDWDLGANTIQGANMITSIQDYANFYPKTLFHIRNF
jgi:hypothetical protein